MQRCLFLHIYGGCHSKSTFYTLILPLSLQNYNVCFGIFLKKTIFMTKDWILKLKPKNKTLAVKGKLSDLRK